MASGKSLADRREKPSRVMFKEMPSSARKDWRGGTTYEELRMRADRTLDRQIRLKVKAGRPGRPSNAPPVRFSWDAVVKASMKKPKVAA